MKKLVNFVAFLLLFTGQLFSQSAGEYVFSYSTGTYTTISGTSSTATGDDGTQNVTIPFTFNYCGQAYTSARICTNGWLEIGTTYAGNDWTNDMASTTVKPVVAGLWDDLYLSAGNILYTTLGTSPNQIFVVQWTDVLWYYSGGTPQNFQIRLYQTTNVIDIIYGTMTTPVGGPFASIGINDQTGGSTHFLSVTPESPPLVSNTTANNSVSAITYLTSGTTYTFSPPATPILYVAPGSLAFGYVPYPGIGTEQSYVLSGAYLNEGPIVVTAPAAFGVSLTTGGPYTPSVNLVYTPPTLSNTNIYVMFTPLAANNQYSDNVTNVGGGASANVAVTGSSALIYCTAGSNTCDEYIGRVQVATIDNSSSCVTGGYTDYTSISTNMMIAVGYPITITNPMPYSADQCAVWGDWNKDGDFYDTGESFTLTNVGGAGASFTGTITPPAGAVEQSTRLRIRITYTGILDPCGATIYGEVEDYLVNITLPACPQPYALNATNITATSANLTWTPVGAETAWEYIYGMSPLPAPSGSGTPTTSSTANPISPLLPQTTYQYYVRADCGGEGFSDWSGPYTFSTPVSCPAPTALIVTNITGTSANLSWTPGGTETAWEYAYGVPPFPVPSGAGTATGSSIENPISPLISHTTYQYYVRANCGVGDLSSWSGPYTFTTTCDIANLLLSESFSTGFWPSGWTEQLTGLITSSHWTFPTSNVAGGIAPEAEAVYYPGEGATQADNDRLVSPAINTSGLTSLHVSFHQMLNDYVCCSNVWIKVQSSSDGVNWTDEWSYLGGRNESIPAEIKELDIINNLGATTYIAWTLSGFTYDINYWYIDDVCIEALITCPAPTALTAVPSPFQAVLGWTETGTAISWDIEYGTTPYTYTGIPTITGVTNPYTLSGLIPVTEYTYKVRAICGDETSNWSEPQTFTTTLPPPEVYLGEDVFICTGETVTLDAGNPGATYLWSTGETTQTIAVTTSGLYGVMVTNAGGSGYDEVNVTFYPLPIADAGSDVLIYIGYPPLSAQLNASGGVSYLWSPATGLSDLTIPNPVASPSSTTVYTVTVTDANGCIDSDDVTVEVMDVRCGINMNKVLVCHYPPGNPGNPQTICIDAHAVPAHLAEHNGDHLGSCQGTDSYLIAVQETEPLEAFSVNVYPNPFENSCNIDVVMDQASQTTVRVVDVLGRVLGKVYAGQLSKGTHNFTWSYDNNANSGSIYYLQVITNKDLRTVKLFVK
jgi:hypothetical protein